jgi:Tfp pilus assembly protein PilP
VAVSNQLTKIFLSAILAWPVLALAQEQAPSAGAPSAGAKSLGAPSTGATAIETKETVKQQGHSDELFLQGMMDAFDYKPRQRRDPFFPPVLDRPVQMGAKHGPLIGLQKFELSSLKLIGIVWDVKRPRAMIADPNGKVHVVGPNAKIGARNGYVAVIREGEIVVVETIEGDSGRLTTAAQVVKLAK